MVRETPPDSQLLSRISRCYLTSLHLVIFVCRKVSWSTLTSSHQRAYSILKKYCSYSSILSGYCVAQIHVVFQITPKASARLFPTHSPNAMPKHFTYVKWFSQFTCSPDNNHGMYKITHSLKDGECLASVIPVNDIVRSVVLFPKFGSVAPCKWSTSTVLEECTTFYVNPFTDRHSYLNLY